jgi:peptide/nickel transport system substrate-binding protein
VDDLRFTWQLAAHAPIARAGYDQISRIVTLTPKRARIEFRAPFARWRDLFSAGLGVLPAHALATPRAQASLSSGWPVSGGPFVLKAWHPGLDMIFEPNPRAWDGKPKLLRLRVVFVPDSLGALTLFRNGAVDALGPYQSPDWSKRVSAVPGASLTTDTGLTWMGIVLNTGSKLLGDVKVRRAFADSMDRGLLVRGLVQGEGESLDGIPPATTGAFASYGDVKRARATLEADGWRGAPIRSKGGTKLSFTIAVADSDDLGQVLGRAIQYQAIRANIDVELVTLPVDEIMSSWLTGPRFQAAILEWRDPPGGALRARFGGTDASVAATVPVIPLATLAVSLVASARAHGLVASADADGPFWNVEQWSVS